MATSSFMINPETNRITGVWLVVVDEAGHRVSWGSDTGLSVYGSPRQHTEAVSVAADLYICQRHSGHPRRAF